MRIWLAVACLAMVLTVEGVAKAEDYNIEEHFDAPVRLPAEVISQVASDIGDEFRKYGCDEPSVEAVLEGTAVRIGPRGRRGLLVRPKSPCACAVHSCPFWLFVEEKPEHFKVVAKVDAHSLTIDEKKTAKGLFELQAWSGTAGWDDRSTWTYDGNKYKQTKHRYRAKSERRQ